MIDFSNEIFIINRYGGSEKKRTMIYNGLYYMVKFPDPVREKKNQLSYMHNAFSEDIGCRIVQSLGIPTQKTMLGTVTTPNGKKKIVVACEDFCQDGATLSEFSKLLTNDIDSDRKISKSSIEIETVMEIMDATPDLAGRTDLKERFWDLFVADTLIGNSDRHLDNWGFLTKGNKIEFAPIYDCGSSLSPLFTEEKMRLNLLDKNLFKDNEYNLSSPYTYKGKRIFYPKFYENPPEELTVAMMRIYPQINMDRIQKIIEQTEGMSDLHKEYMLHSVKYRYENILQPAMKRIEKLEEQTEACEFFQQSMTTKGDWKPQYAMMIARELANKNFSSTSIAKAIRECVPDFMDMTDPEQLSGNMAKTAISDVRGNYTERIKKTELTR